MDRSPILAPPALLLMLMSACPAHADTFVADCLIEPTQQVSIGTPVTGVLDQVWVKRGSRVAKGQVVASLVSGVEQAAVQLAQFKANQTAQADMAERKLGFAKSKFERRQSMSQEKLMPQQESDDAEAEYRLAEAEWMIARENQQIAQLEFKQQKAQLEQRTIRSPLNGVVVDQSAFAGEVVESGGNAKPIVRLAQLDPLRVQVILPKSRFGKIRAGSSVDVTPESPIAGKYTARIKSIDKLLDAASGTFVVFLELPNSKLNIPAGVKCQAAFKE